MMYSPTQRRLELNGQRPFHSIPLTYLPTCSINQKQSQ